MDRVYFANKLIEAGLISKQEMYKIVMSSIPEPESVPSVYPDFDESKHVLQVSEERSYATGHVLVNRNNEAVWLTQEELNRESYEKIANSSGYDVHNVGLDFISAYEVGQYINVEGKLRGIVMIDRSLGFVYTIRQEENIFNGLTQEVINSINSTAPGFYFRVSDGRTYYRDGDGKMQLYSDPSVPRNAPPSLEVPCNHKFIQLFTSTKCTFCGIDETSYTNLNTSQCEKKT